MTGSWSGADVTLIGADDGNENGDNVDELNRICGKCVDMFVDEWKSCDFVVVINGITFGCKSSAETVFCFKFWFNQFCDLKFAVVSFAYTLIINKFTNSILINIILIVQST